GAEPTDIERDGREQVLEVDLGQADVAGAAQIAHPQGLPDGAFDAGAGPVARLEVGGRLILAAGRPGEARGGGAGRERSPAGGGPGRDAAPGAGSRVLAGRWGRWYSRRARGAPDRRRARSGC